jgi:multidrug efflux pump subunit AcrA (membrane-fusion protein)
MAMIAFLMRYWLYVVIAGASIAAASFLSLQHDQTADWTTATVERGNVTEVVSVSGFTEAPNLAELSFPTSGLVSGIFVNEGSDVAAGDLLASIGSEALVSERERTLASLRAAEASRAELLAGPTSESRAVTSATIAQAEAAYQQTIGTELTKIRNAEQALRSNDLQAYTLDDNDDEPAPVITGSYTCDDEGEYLLSVYNSGTRSGYSFRLSGLETNTYSVTTDQPTSIGDCGLAIEWSPDVTYGNTEWVIPVPNTRSSSYVTVLNAYNLAVTQAEQNITAAREALRLAENRGTAANAAPRVEALIRANAEVQLAQANLATIDAQLADRAIVAPFAGVVTDVALVPGEVARADTVITLLSQDEFEVQARIPEIDITKIEPAQKVRVNFDAKRDETLTGTIRFVSPLPTEIDGVAYFETLVALDNTPTWLKAGLNADIDIIITEATDVLRLPERFLTRTTDGTYEALIPEGETLTTTAVETGVRGNEGYIEVISLSEGATVVAP